jgi:hypothetical protein
MKEITAAGAYLTAVKIKGRTLSTAIDRYITVNERSKLTQFQHLKLTHIMWSKAPGGPPSYSRLVWRLCLSDVYAFLRRLLCANWYEVLPISMMTQWCVKRSRSAVVILASPKTGTHSANSRLVVMMTLVFS